MTRYLRCFVARDARVDYVPLYNIHRTEGQPHTEYLERARRAFGRW